MNPININTPKILIVENELIIAADLSLQLSTLDYHVVGIHTRAEDALKTIKKNRPDLILMDVNLAGKMDGVQAAAHILKTSKIPVIFLTSSSELKFFYRATKTRPYAFISKPFQKESIRRGVELALKKIAKEGENGYDNRSNLFIRIQNYYA